MPVDPGDPYATLAEMRAYLGVNGVNADRDALITAAAGAASRWIDEATGRRFTYDAAPSTITYRTLRRTFATSADYGLVVPDIGTSTGLSTSQGDVSYEAVSGWPITILYSGAPWPEPTVSITARFGWPEVPDQIVLATKILAARLYRRKDSPEGIVGSEAWGAIRVTRVDPDVQALISPYSLPGMA